MQYTPVLNTGLNWQLYNGDGFTGAVDIPRDTWFHLRLEVTGAQARLFVKDMEKPALVMPDLKSGLQKGQVALAALIGATCFSNFEIRTTPDAPWERHLPAMPPGTLVKWSLSPTYDALQRDLERPLSSAERAAITWQEVEAEPPGIVTIYRYREAPHPRVTFQGDFSKRLDPQPGMKMLYARTSIAVRPGPGEEAVPRLQRRRQRVPQRQDPLPRPQRPGLPRSRVPGHRQPRERRGLPAAQEGKQRARAGAERAGRRLGIHRHGWWTSAAEAVG